MIAFNRNFLLESSGAGKIMNKYGISREIASYLILIYPYENENKWKEYESAKEFLLHSCSSSEEYERANKCLVDRLGI